MPDDPVIIPVVSKPAKPSITLDAYIAVGIAALTALSLGLSTEESWKYINPYLRFWLVLAVGVTTQGIHALAKFRDGKYQRSLDTTTRQEEADRSGKASVTTSTVSPTVKP